MLHCLNNVVAYVAFIPHICHYFYTGEIFGEYDKYEVCTCWRESAPNLAPAVCRGSPVARMCRTPGWRDLVDASFCIFVIYISLCAGHLGGDIVGGWFVFFSVCLLGGEVDNVLAQLKGGRPGDILPSGLQGERDMFRVIAYRC